MHSTEISDYQVLPSMEGPNNAFDTRNYDQRMQELCAPKLLKTLVVPGLCTCA